MAEYVTFDLSKKQVITDKPYHSEKNGKDYFRVIAPNGGTFLYPADSLKPKADDPDRYTFMRPVDAEVTIRYSEKIAGVPDDAPNAEKYANHDEKMTFGELYKLYQSSKEEYKAARAEQAAQFMRMEVPEDWGRHFETKEESKELVAISVPIREEDNTVNFYQFVVSAELFRSNEQHLANFSFPISKKDVPGEDYMVNLQRTVLSEDGSRVTVSRQISTSDLADVIEVAKKSAESKVRIEISDKLVRKFTNNEGQLGNDVSIPIYEPNAVEPAFWHIVVPDYRIKHEDNGYGTKKTVLILPDSFEFKATHGVKTDELDPETGKNIYENEERTLTSKDIEDAFEESNRRYEESQNATVAQTQHRGR